VDTALNQLEGKYEILEKLSEGGMGAVYKVRHRLLEELRVVKVMRPHLARDEVLRARFVQEAKMAIRLRHRNIAQIYDFTVDDEGAFFLVMEYIDGINLFDLLKSAGPPSLGMTLEIAHQSLGVLAYLHRKEIIHRDISPDNLMLCRDEEEGLLVKLIDLGIAKTMGGGENLTATGAFLGKVRYSSPEQFRTQEGREVGPASDLYSFGVVLYELLTGHYPIRGNSLTTLITGHLNDPPMPFPESDPTGKIPEKLRSVVLRALEKDPGKRFSSARAFRSALGEMHAAFPVDAVEMRELLRIFSAKTEKIPVVRPGSTQDRLDRNFGARTTPAPGTEVINRQPEADASFRALLLGVEKLLESGHLEEATLQIRSAASMKPGHPEVESLQQKLHALSEEGKARYQESLARIRDTLAVEDLERAEKYLARTEAEFGTSDELRKLAEDTSELRREIAVREERIAGILLSARDLMASQEWEDAVLMLREALILKEGHPEATVELEKAEAGLQAQLEAKRRQLEIANALQRIREFLKQGEPGKARRALRVARKVSKGAPEFDGIEDDIARLEEQQRQERKAALIAEARILFDARDLQNAGEYLEEALRLDPESREAAMLLQEVREARRLQEEEEKRQREISRALEGVDRLVLAGRLETAVHYIEDIVGNYGSSEDAEELEDRIREELKRQAVLHEDVLKRMEAAAAAEQTGDFVRAGEELAAARRDAGEFPEILAEIEAEIERLVQAEKEYRHRMEINRACEAISRQLKSAAFDEAERELKLAERLYESELCWSALRHDLEEARKEERIHELLREALSGSLGFDATMDRIETALGLDPGNRKIQRLLEDTRTVRKQFLENQRREAIAAVLHETDELIREGKLRQALKQIERALKEQGSFPQGLALRRRLKNALSRK